MDVGKMVRNMLYLQSLWSVLEGVWQLVSLNSNCCTCIYCSWIFVGDVLGFGPTMFFGRWNIWRRLWQRRLRRWIAVRAKARCGRFAFCGHRFESWEMLRAESVRRSPNWKKPSKQWRDGRKSSICRWWRWRAFCDGFEVVVLMLRVF